MKSQNLAEPTAHPEVKTSAEIFDVAAGCRFPGLVSGRHFNKPANVCFPPIADAKSLVSAFDPLRKLAGGNLLKRPCCLLRHRED